jgi:phosphatidate cytidylyltransferase
LNNFVTRLLTGILTSAIVIASVWYSDWGFFIIFLIAQFFCQLEFYTLIRKAKAAKPLEWAGIAVGSFAYIFTFLRFHKFKELGLDTSGVFDAKYFALLFPFLGLIFLIELYRKRENPFANIAYTILGIVYASLPFTLFLHIAYSTTGEGYSWQIILGVLLMLWASDSGAYFAGRTLGKTKLFERISPKKTWEGSIGGLVLSLVFAYGISLYWYDLAFWQWAGMSVIIVVIGGYGDLVESLLKRSLDIKDSSNFLPGHGGFLDRFDGLLLALPFLACFLILVV